MSASGLVRVPNDLTWGDLAEHRRVSTAEREAIEASRRRRSASRRRRSAEKRNRAARKIQSTFRKARAKFAVRSGKSRAASLRRAKRIGRVTRRRLAGPVKFTYTPPSGPSAPSGPKDYWVYEDRKAFKNPQEGQMRWKLLPSDVNLPIEMARPDEETFEIWKGEGAAGHWTKAYDPMGNYGGPFTNKRNLYDNPRKAAHNAEQAAAFRAAQEAEMRARAAAAGGIPADAAMAIAARVGKAAQAQAKARGATKAEAGAEYKAAYEDALEGMSMPGMTLEIALGAAQNIEAAAGIAGPSAREARRALARSGAAAGGV